MAIGLDSRIGNKFLDASVGFGGSCFKKVFFFAVFHFQERFLGPVELNIFKWEFGVDWSSRILETRFENEWASKDTFC